MNWGGASAPLFYCAIHVSRGKLPLGRILHPAGAHGSAGSAPLAVPFFAPIGFNWTDQWGLFLL